MVELALLCWSTAHCSVTEAAVVHHDGSSATLRLFEGCRGKLEQSFVLVIILYAM